jgi:hypothetical protein
MDPVNCLESKREKEEEKQQEEGAALLKCSNRGVFIAFCNIL